MAWTTPTTQNPGDAILASLWNTQVKDNLLELAPFFAAWTSWTPALTGSGFTITQGNSSVSGKYLKIGRTVSFWAKWTFGSTTSFGAGTGGFVATIPFVAASGDTLSNIVINCIDSGSAHYSLMNRGVDNNTSQIFIAPVRSDLTYAQQGSITSTTPFTWAVNDTVWWGGTYEAAS